MNGIRSRFQISDHAEPAHSTYETAKNGFAKFMQAFGRVALETGKVMLPFVPGGIVIGSALDMLGKKNQDFGGFQDGLDPYSMLNLQKRMLQEAELYTLISNIMKLRHDSAMNAIRNIR